MKYYIILLLVGLNIVPSYAQESPYHLSKKLDWTLTGIGVGLYAGGFLAKDAVDAPTLEMLNQLDINTLPNFEQFATENWSPKSAELSDVLLIGSIILPLSTLVDENIRKDVVTLGVIFSEAALISISLVDLSKGLGKRYRPFAYNSDAPLEERLKQSTRFSFFSGHTSESAMVSFLTAKVLSDYYPGAKWLPYTWTLAAIYPAVTGYLRIKAGKHFITDIVAGYAAGALIGYLVPHLHKKENMQLSVLPTFEGGAVLQFQHQF